jgi:hypothetical protein
VWGLALIFRENILALILAATNKDPSENLQILFPKCNRMHHFASF